MMNKDISRFISVSRLPVIMGPVLIHAHWPVIMESSFQHSCCVVGWITVPLFFLISGFLYFQGYDGSIDVYIGKLKKRFRSLLVPYLIWNTIAYFVFAYLLGLQDPSHFIQSYWSVPENANAPADGPLWFIQKLIIYTVLAPLFFFIISSRYSKYIVAVAFGLFLFNAPMTDRGLIIGFIFFLGGGYCAYHQNTPPLIHNCMSKVMCNVIKCIMIFVFGILIMIETMFEEGTYIQGLIYHWILFVGIFICFFIYGYIKDGMIADSLSKMGGYSFFVYCVHMLLVNPVHRVVEYAMGISSASYIVSFLLISSWSLLLAWLVNKYFTKAFKILIGGR